MKKFLLLFYFLFFFKAFSSVSKINSISFIGNKKYNDIFYSKCLNVGIGENFNDKIKNDIIKCLFSTEIVKDVDIKFNNNGDLFINLKEKSFVSKITFNGNKKLKEDIIKLNLKLKVKEVFSENKLSQDLDFIKSFYKSIGFFNIHIDTEIKNINDDLVEVFFNIKEGKKSKIENIYFIGNDKFSSKTLRDVVFSREKRFYNFYSSKVSYNADILDYDSHLLKMFYFSNGYINFKVNSINGVLNKNNNFDLFFDIVEGKRYLFGKFDIEDNIGIVKNIDELDKIIKSHIKKNKVFNINILNLIADKITNYLKDEKFFTVNYNFFQENEDSSNIYVKFSIDSTQKLYVGKVLIMNNLRTSDSVIRNEINMFEGDPFDKNKLIRSINKIKNLGFFKDVKYSIEETYNDKVNLLIDVEEQSTGNLSFGVGYNTSYGLNGVIGLNQRNLFGEGISLSTNININSGYNNYNISLYKPKFLNTEITSGINLFYIKENNSKVNSINIGYNESRRGSVGSLSFNLTDVISSSISYSVNTNELTNISEEYNEILSDRNDLVSEFSLDLTFDNRIGSFSAKEGYVLSYDLSFAGIFGTKDYLKHILYSAYYLPFYSNKFIWKLEGRFGYIHSLNDNYLFPDDGFYLGGSNMRGFRSGGIGPRVKRRGGSILDNYGLSGNRLYYLNTELKFPLFLPREFSIYGVFFLNTGTVTGIENNPKVNKNLIEDSGSFRSAAGFSILWETIFGNITFDFSKIIKKESYDVSENFRFNIGTNF